ncbi:hypothetical protein [Phyllobacterium sp. OV277]|jgi:hypothetical protein|uniref:hypothetical protein n=1 Tax=Phyllobacterium sp. OV277 TaxID=1882772 RepID=UPI000889D5C2|nr:hypothetical protein [Phyllobacterium sp. OV277]SDN84470.1 hypothetical protein SAMN05443582_101294 [Phyllobacterium sp. OV277]
MHALTLLLAVIAAVLLAFQANPRREHSSTNTSGTRYNDADIAVFVFAFALVMVITMMVWSR